MTIDISIQEAAYIDPRAGNDKFYRVFVLGSTWVTQYGRNGTIGIFTKLIETASPKAAQNAADAKFASKVKKGYDPVRSGTLTSAVDITAENLALLDELAQALPVGAATTIVTAPVNPVDIGADRKANITATVARALDDKFFSSPARTSDLRPDLPVRPMLASVQPETLVDDAMRNPSWIAQFKYDGDRVVIEVTDGEIRVLNRQGQEKTKNVGAAHLSPFTALHSGRWVFDGEVVGRTLVLFDLVTATDGTHTWIRETDVFLTRYVVLQKIADILGIPAASRNDDRENLDPVVIAPIAFDDEKIEFLAAAVSEQREGVILRHREGLYESGRRSTTLIKHKLIKDADVVVTALHDTKQSATLSVYDAADNLVEVGSASTIGKGDVSVGDVWLVTFLYVTDPRYPRLVQPRLVHKRSDKFAAECVVEQFADAGTNKIV